MELRDIEYFAVVARFGHVGRAAESLGLSQPALSKSLRRLEQSMQVKLVKRTPKGVELTAAGTTLLAEVHRLRLSLDDVMRAVADVSDGRAGHLRVGAGAGIAGQLLPAAYNALLKATPEVTLDVSVRTTEMLVPALLAGELDLIISTVCAVPDQRLIQEHLFDDEMLVVSSGHHRLAKQKRVTLADVARERWALSAVNVQSWQWMHKAFEAAGLAAPRVAMVGPTSLRLPMVAASDLLGFCSRRTAHIEAPPAGLADLRVKKLQWVRRIGVSYRKEAYLSPAARRMIDILRSAAENLARRAGP